MIIKNPVLKGFNPDPSLIYVDGVFYLATSTFEWFPGVNIYASTDLADWKLVTRPVDEHKINLRGIPQSGGVWAPCLSYNKYLKKFFLVFSNQHTWANHPFKDCNNYIIYADKIEGPWSDPIYINSSGFDASLFHDDDGKIYYLNMEWDYRKTDRAQFSGILLAEYDFSQGRLKEEMRKIFLGTKLARIEGPHIYKRGEWYYLFTAEGGTSYEHAVTVCRSKNVYGPYEVHPYEQILTSYQKDVLLQKSGHASICQDGNGDWWLAHLCGRPLKNGRCILGRETAIQPLEWIDDWPYIKNKQTIPYLEFETKFPSKQKKQNGPIRYPLNNKEFLQDFLTLRLPFNTEKFRIEEDGLVLIGKDSLLSTIEQTVIGRRQTHFEFKATVELTFNPTNFQEMAGLMYRYDETNQFYLYMTFDERRNKKVLSTMSFDQGRFKMLDETLQAEVGCHVYLQIEVHDECGQFRYSEDGVNFKKIGSSFDASILSDDYTQPMGFTGAFICLACQDLRYHAKEAKFKNFIYEEL